MCVLSRLKFVLPAVLVTVLMSGCTLETPSKVTDREIELRTQEHGFRMPVEEMNDSAFEQIGRHYWRFGSGEVHVAVSYDPRSRVDTAMGATHEMTRIIEGLRKAGIAQISGDILPAENSAQIALVSYTSVTASPPEGCQTMPGSDGKSGDIQEIEEYEMGCGIKTHLARQIARPKDLRGQGGSPPSDSSRAVNTIIPYKLGPAAEE